jgi:hypothetical protein
VLADQGGEQHLEDLSVDGVSEKHALAARGCSHVVDPSGDEYPRLSGHDHERRPASPPASELAAQSAHFGHDSFAGPGPVRVNRARPC